MHRKLIRHRRQKKLRRWLLITGLVLLFLTWFILFQARAPMRKAHSEAYKIAQSSAQIQSDQKFFMADLNRTYYTILGTTSHNQQRYVIIDKNNGKTVVVNAKNAISEAQATQIVKTNAHATKILNTAPSIDSGRAVWLVSYLNQNRQLCYDTLQFNNGKSLKLMTNI